MEYVFLLLSLAAVVFGAEYLVSGSVSIARKLHISDFVIGALVVGVGTSMPELCVSVIGAINGNSDVAIGNVVGSNIFNVFAILGVTAAIFPIAVSRTNMKFELPVCIAVSVMLLLLTWNFFAGGNPVIGRLDGLVLVMTFLFFITYSFRRDRKSAAVQEQAHEDSTPVWLAAVKVIGGLAVLITGSHFFVEEAVVIARNFGVDDAYISITLIACGTSLPELAASIAAAAKKNTELALGNIIGSNIFNITLILGISSLITPLNTGGITMTDYIVMILAAVFPAVLGFRGKIGRAGGYLMLVCFIAYNVYLINSQI